MAEASGIRRRRREAASAPPGRPHGWARDLADDLRRRIANYRGSLSVTTNADDRQLLLQCIAATELELAGVEMQ